MRIWNFIKLTVSAIRLQRHPENTSLVFDVGDTLYKLNALQEARRIIGENPECQKLIQNRVLLENFSLESLAQLPVGTLGQAYAHHMISNKLDPEFYRRPDKITDETYFILRLRQTHDLWHVVTGFDTTVLGELSLQAFMMAQIATPLSMILISFSILKTTFHEQENIFALMDGITKGWQMGRSAGLFLPYDWAGSWSKDLGQVRQELGLSKI